MLQARRSRFRFLMRSSNFFIWPNSYSRTMALGTTQPLAEMSTRNVPGGKGRLTTSPPSVSRLSIENLGASTSHYLTGFHGLLQGCILAWNCSIFVRDDSYASIFAHVWPIPPPPPKKSLHFLFLLYQSENLIAKNRRVYSFMSHLTTLFLLHISCTVDINMKTFSNETNLKWTPFLYFYPRH
jgi:hypothetical protein